MPKPPLTKILILSAALWAPVACGKVGKPERPPGDTPYPGTYPAPELQLPSRGGTGVKSH